MSKSNIETKADIIASNIENWEYRTLERIGNRIKRTGQLSKHNRKALDDISNIDDDIQEIYKDLARVTELNISEVQKMYEAEMTEQVMRNQALYNAMGVPFIPYNENAFAQHLVKTWVAQTTSEIINNANSKVIGFKVSGGKTFAPIDKAYQSAMDKATDNIRTGRIYFYTAIQETIDDLGGGIVNCKNGIVRPLDAVIRSNIIYGIKQSAQQYQRYIGEQFGADGCEIDYHSHPRPSHAPMGGTMFTYSKESETIDGVTYPSFYKPYKDEKSPEDLLNEYNCLHFATDVILGISEPTWDKKELERRKAEDKELIEYTVKKERNGEVIEEKTLYKTRYEWSQKQRNLERMAREEKRQAHFSKACGNNIKARQHEENLQQIKTAYNDLCEKTGLQMTAN